jgi:uncharacterized membrane protein
MLRKPCIYVTAKAADDSQNAFVIYLLGVLHLHAGSSFVIVALSIVYHIKQYMERKISGVIGLILVTVVGKTVENNARQRYNYTIMHLQKNYWRDHYNERYGRICKAD